MENKETYFVIAIEEEMEIYKGLDRDMFTSILKDTEGD